MLVKANEVLLDNIDALERSCAYNGKYVQRIVAGVEVEDLYIEQGKCKTYCSRLDIHSTVELDENGMFDLEVHLVTYEDVTEQVVGGVQSGLEHHASVNAESSILLASAKLKVEELNKMPITNFIAIYLEAMSILSKVDKLLLDALAKHTEEF